MNACEITAAITVIANTLATRLTDDQLTMLSAIFNQLGDTLNTIAVYRSVCSDSNPIVDNQ